MSQQEVKYPRDPVELRPRLRSGSRWTKRELEWLNVEYEPTRHYRFDFQDIALSPEIQEGIDLSYLLTGCLGVEEICQGMAAMDMEAVRARKVNWRTLEKSWPALAFSNAYARLSSILEKGQSSSATLAGYTTPPNQTTIPVDPKYSDKSGSTISSGDEKREHYAELFANDVVTASITALQLDARPTIPWLDPTYDFLLTARYFILFSF